LAVLRAEVIPTKGIYGSVREQTCRDPSGETRSFLKDQAAGGHRDKRPSDVRSGSTRALWALLD
jgi:hypothetical protein